MLSAVKHHSVLGPMEKRVLPLFAGVLGVSVRGVILRGGSGGRVKGRREEYRERMRDFVLEMGRERRREVH